MALRGTNQEAGRHFNRRIVLEAIRLNGPITRGRIAEQVHLTVQTVSTIIRELEDQGFVLSVREEPRGRGIPPARLRINPDGGYAVGLHVTPLGIDAALVSLGGEIVGSLHRAAAAASPDAAFGLIAEMVDTLKGLRPRGRMLGVGLALPGPFDVESMSFVGPTTMAGWGNVALGARLAEATGLPAFFEADMAAAALGERLYGLGAEFTDFYYLYFGVGLGGAMVHGGVTLRGAFGNAGEIGHIPAVPDGEPCPCGNRGCLERYVSMEAFGRCPEGTSAHAWVASVAPILRGAVTTIENLFDPQTIILGGLVSPALVAALEEACTALPNSVAARRDRSTPRVLVSKAGRHAVLRGAAALAIAGVLSPQSGQLFAPETEHTIGGGQKGMAA